MSGRDIAQLVAGGGRQRVSGGWRGRALEDSGDPGDPLAGVLNAYDPDEPYAMRWMPDADGNGPNEGDELLVILDDEMAAWIVAWWPAGLDSEDGPGDE